ncbi:hypothetical protein CDEST_01118 [Colletotrichum destructivum]|uniref:Uncharacterized protein n=1 Tax=Colletotrichum destructivum TaxID=34406 RepID=A0AAX4HZF4_9PEZI|nr:hypothetical protein CDEST_01118 [Colletotrichum destructivum]
MRRIERGGMWCTGIKGTILATYLGVRTPRRLWEALCKRTRQLKRRIAAFLAPAGSSQDANTTAVEWALLHSHRTHALLATVQDRLGSGPRGPLALAPPQHHLLKHCEQSAARERVGESEQGITLLNPSWKSLGVLAPSAWALSSWPWITSSLGANGLIGGAKTTAIFPNFITPPSIQIVHIHRQCDHGRCSGALRQGEGGIGMLTLQVPTNTGRLISRRDHSTASAAQFSRKHSKTYYGKALFLGLGPVLAGRL